MVSICPNPKKWNVLFKQLSEHANTHVCIPSRPPAPLILAGWAYSNDVEKMLRWRETVDWAEANGCTDILETILDNDFYTVDEPSDYQIGPLGGPCYRPWDFEAKLRPSPNEIVQHFEYLSAHWANIIESGLAAITRPWAFTGKKARRLVVQAESAAVPPWGDWTSLSPDEQKRRAFTRFRSAVNTAIAPHEVDHIDFVVGGARRAPLTL